MNPTALLAEYGSPAYVYNLARVRDAHARLTASLPATTTLYYSVKANPHPGIIRQLASCGCSAEISSLGELSAALSAGVDPAECLYTGPGKGSAEITRAVDAGVRHFSVDSPRDLRRVARSGEQRRVRLRALLRVNPDCPPAGAGLAMTGVPSQFGADASWIRSAPALFAANRWLEVIGFHFFLGTNISSPAVLLETFAQGVGLARELADILHIDPEVIDLGGGFGHPFGSAGAPFDFSGLREPLELVLDETLAGWRRARPGIAFESGRYLVAAAGTLFATVEDVKVSKERTFAILDTGIHHLGGMAGLRRIPSIAAQPLAVEVPSVDQQLTEVEIVGPLCTPLDRLAHQAMLPALEPGTILAIPNVGAYGLTASLVAFLSRDPPVEILVDGDRVKDASRIRIVRQYDHREPR